MIPCVWLISVFPRHQKITSNLRPLLVLHTTCPPKFSMEDTVRKLIFGLSALYSTPWSLATFRSRETGPMTYSTRLRGETSTSIMSNSTPFPMNAKIWFAIFWTSTWARGLMDRKHLTTLGFQSLAQVIVKTSLLLKKRWSATRSWSAWKALKESVRWRRLRWIWLSRQRMRMTSESWRVPSKPSIPTALAWSRLRSCRTS